MKRTALATMVTMAFAGAATADEIFFSDFEADDGGWEADANWGDGSGDWEWGEPTNVGPDAFSGVNVWATVLDDFHSNADGNNWLRQTFDFSGFVNVELSFQNWINSGSNSFDQAKVFVNDTEVFFSDGDSGGQWEEVVIDLSAFDGMSDVEIVFDFFATSVVNREGWYIADVGITGDPDVACLEMTLENLVGGEVGTWTVTGGQPDSLVVVAWGTGGPPSTFEDTFGWCASFGFNIELQGRRFKIVGADTFDADGVAVVERPIPANVSGRTFLFQAAERGTCPSECMSDVFEEVID